MRALPPGLSWRATPGVLLLKPRTKAPRLITPPAAKSGPNLVLLPRDLPVNLGHLRKVANAERLFSREAQQNEITKRYRISASELGLDRGANVGERRQWGKVGAHGEPLLL